MPISMSKNAALYEYIDEDIALDAICRNIQDKIGIPPWISTQVVDTFLLERDA